MDSSEAAAAECAHGRGEGAAWRTCSSEIEAYYDAVPRPGADAEDVGPFTLFVSRGGWPYYARPRRGYAGPAATVQDVLRVRALQRERDLPESFEWVDDLVPGLVEVVEQAGLPVERLPLMALTGPVAAAPVSGVRVRIVAPDDPDLARITATVSLGLRLARHRDRADRTE